jgi:hypothetical protein
MDDITSSRKTRRVEGTTPYGSLSPMPRNSNQRKSRNYSGTGKEGFNLDDREMLSQARDLASSHGYTVLQAVQEWHSSKGCSKAMPLGEVIEKFLAAKSNRSAAYMDKLNADMRLFLSHFGADRSIDRIGSDEIEDFLDSKKAASRRRNNLRSEIITLFRYAQIRLRALHRDLKTEAELVLRDQTKRKPVETFSPTEFNAPSCPSVT